MTQETISILGLIRGGELPLFFALLFGTFWMLEEK